jgi:hypothetical protein
MRSVPRWCLCVAMTLAGCKDHDGNDLAGVDGPEEHSEDPYIDAPCEQLTVARTCPDCDVRVDWTSVTRDWWGNELDPATFEYASVGAWDPPIDEDLMIRALCAGAAIEKPEEPGTMFRELEGTSVVLGQELPRITVEDRFGLFSAGGYSGYIVALLVPDAESTNDLVVLP